MSTNSGEPQTPSRSILAVKTSPVEVGPPPDLTRPVRLDDSRTGPTVGLEVGFSLLRTERPDCFVKERECSVGNGSSEKYSS